jgi:hypothetical protein
MTWRIYSRGKLFAVGQLQSPLRRDCTIAARLRLRRPLAAAQTYTATFALNDENGIFLERRLTIRTT